jgi:hypothetical protein
MNNDVIVEITELPIETIIKLRALFEKYGKNAEQHLDEI